MDDLFALFPDLPSLPRKSVQERVEAIRRQAEDVRCRMKVTTSERRAVAKRAQQNWRKKVGR